MISKDSSYYKTNHDIRRKSEQLHFSFVTPSGNSRKLPHITQATLTAQLKQLERDGILLREAYAESPPRVEYKLTEIGKSLIPVMDLLCAWGEDYQRRTGSQ